MKRAIAYVRVSTTDQAQNNLSLQGQQEAIKRYCNEKNIHLLEIFVEPGASAKTMEREQWLASMDYCRTHAKEIDYYIVWKLDRFSRKTENHAVMAANIRKLGIKLESVTESIDETPAGRFMEIVLAGMAEYDNNLRIQRTVEGMQRRREQGGFTAPAPLGYKNIRDDLKRPTLYKTEIAPIVASLFRDFIKGGYTLKGLAKEANVRGLRSRSGKELSYQTLRQMLANPVYAGYIRHKGSEELIEGLHEGIIGKDEYYAIQDILSGSRRSHVVSDDEDWPLRGFVRCHTCHGFLTSSTPKGRSGQRFPSYACTKCRRKTVGHRVSIPQEELHEEFEAVLDNMKPTEAHLELFKLAFLEKWRKAHTEKLDEQITLEKQLAELKLRKARILDMYIDGKLTDEEKSMQSERVEKDIVALSVRLDSVKDEALDAETILEFGINMIKDMNKFWRSCSLTGRVRLQQALFPEGICYDFTTGFRTAKISEIYEVIQNYSTENTNLVPRVGIEPTAKSLEVSCSIH